MLLDNSFKLSFISKLFETNKLLQLTWAVISIDEISLSPICFRQMHGKKMQDKKIVALLLTTFPRFSYDRLISTTRISEPANGMFNTMLVLCPVYTRSG